MSTSSTSHSPQSDNVVASDNMPLIWACTTLTHTPESVRTGCRCRHIPCRQLLLPLVVAYLHDGLYPPLCCCNPPSPPLYFSKEEPCAQVPFRACLAETASKPAREGVTSSVTLCLPQTSPPGPPPSSFPCTSLAPPAVTIDWGRPSRPTASLAPPRPAAVSSQSSRDGSLPALPRAAVSASRDHQCVRSVGDVLATAALRLTPTGVCSGEGLGVGWPSHTGICVHVCSHIRFHAHTHPHVYSCTHVRAHSIFSHRHLHTYRRTHTRPAACARQLL